jgi:hypothetical protein
MGLYRLCLKRMRYRMSDLSKYSLATFWELLSVTSRVFRLPIRGSMATKAQSAKAICALAFDIAEPRPPSGWYCTHMTITSGGAVMLKPTVACGCEMQPVLASSVTRAA